MVFINFPGEKESGVSLEKLGRPHFKAGDPSYIQTGYLLAAQTQPKQHLEASSDQWSTVDSQTLQGTLRDEAQI